MNTLSFSYETALNQSPVMVLTVLNKNESFPAISCHGNNLEIIEKDNHWNIKIPYKGSREQVLVTKK